MPGNRRFERKTYNESIHFSMSILDSIGLKRVDLTGKATDISDDGIGLETEYPVERGCVLNFFNGIGDKVGFIKWVEKFGNSYRLGAQFV